MRDGTTLNDFMQWDNTLFDNIVLNSEIEFEILVSTIMLKCGLRQPLYENYDVFKSQVHVWFAAHEWNFDRLVRLINEKYNPLWNKDGVEKRTIEVTREDTETVKRGEDFQRGGANTTATTGNESNSLTLGGSDVRTIDESESNNTSRNLSAMGRETEETTYMGHDRKYVTGFNASSEVLTDHTNLENETDRTKEYENTESETSGGSRSGDTEDKTVYGRTETGSANSQQNVTETFGETSKTDEDTQRDLEGTSKTVDEFVAQGNVGLTTSQALFKEELDLLGGFNLYDFIANKFDDDLMIGVFA